jgi:hypothetical protein
MVRGFLKTANNLSDLASATAARANLGLSNAAVQPVLDIPMNCGASSFSTWTAMPAAETVFLGSSRWNQVVKADLSKYTQCRLCFVVGTAGVSGSKIKAKYATSFSTSVGSYSDLGVAEVSNVLTTGSVYAATSWINLASGAMGDVFLMLTGVGGDGAAAPTIGNAHIQFR